jgi:sugar lactone lactonase YvrE
VYPPNPIGTLNETPLAMITGSNTGLNGGEGVAVDPSGKIYVANDYYPGSVTVYAANPSGTLNVSPVATITGQDTELDDPYGVALDASGRIYITNPSGNPSDSSITVYAANPSGTLNEAPVATISGSNTGLYLPYGVALDSSGRIYAGNTDGTITVYAANPLGTLNEAPVATITGNAGLGAVLGIALDRSGNIYATNNYSSTNGPVAPAVTVYAANPSGTLNETPLATITGSNTGLNLPGGIAVDAAGKIYVGNTGSITVYAANPRGTVNEVPLATITGSNTTGGAAGIAIH